MAKVTITFEDEDNRPVMTVKYSPAIDPDAFLTGEGLTPAQCLAVSALDKIREQASEDHG